MVGVLVYPDPEPYTLYDTQSYFFLLQKKGLEDMISGKKRAEIPVPSNQFQKWMYNISMHMFFEFFIVFVIVANMVPIIMAFRIQEGHKLYYKYEDFFFISNLIFTAIFVLEAIIKVLFCFFYNFMFFKALKNMVRYSTMFPKALIT